MATDLRGNGQVISPDSDHDGTTKRRLSQSQEEVLTESCPPGIGGTAPLFRCGQCAFAGLSRLSLSMHVTQVHRPRIVQVRTRSRCVEAALYRQLKLRSPAQRRELLSRHFSQAQRLALERWILAQQCSANAPRIHSRGVNEKCLEASARKRNKCGPPKPGICRRRPHRGVQGRSLYSAHVAVGPLRVFTRAVPDMATAVSFGKVLLAIKREVVDGKWCASKARFDGTLNAFAQAVKEAPGRYGQDCLTMGLSFAAVVPAKYWVGRELWTPRFALPDMQLGLDACRRLNVLRGLVHRGRANRYSIHERNSPTELEAAWSLLRREYINIWVAAGKDWRAVEAKLQRLEAQRLRCRTRTLASKREAVRRGSRQREVWLRGSKSSSAGRTGQEQEVKGLLRCWSKRWRRMQGMKCII
eukprot:TRINITY_DN37427_c0_g1_i1.p1 TRINITY_DN37427_c0_g1~~TRINITY_DN37427_c0_g1_i1.p1  ORF type:complete len:414 (+),score=57.95 TRINITY_DN37427_c0_g1_i1:262-1503(+)